MKADPSFDANAAKANINALKYDDPDSIEALNFFTSERTIYDPFSDIGGDLRTAVSNNVIVKNGDPIEVIDQYYDAVLADLYTQFG